MTPENPINPKYRERETMEEDAEERDEVGPRAQGAQALVRKEEGRVGGQFISGATRGGIEGSEKSQW